MRPRERGATFLGIVIILLILGSALYAGIRLVPVYLEYTKVARSLEQVRDEHAAIDTNPALIRRSLERRWDVEDIHSIGWKEIEIDRSSRSLPTCTCWSGSTRRSPFHSDGGPCCTQMNGPHGGSGIASEIPGCSRRR
jgi:Domain of unknown function (DUF4845)